MAVHLGIDVGTVSVKLALVADEVGRELLLTAARADPELFAGPPEPLPVAAYSQGQGYLLVTRCRRTTGDPARGTLEVLERLGRVIPFDAIRGARLCGSGADLVAALLGIGRENEFRAGARGARALVPSVRTVFEMGGHASRYLALDKTGIADYEESGDCAAGTGSFLDQQALRLRFAIEEVGEVAAAAPRSAKVAGRCSVFAKSDLIHAQQKGYTPAEALKGLCEAVARNFKSSVLKSRKVARPVVFVGGVARNAAVVQALRELLNLSADELIAPERGTWAVAIGAALAEVEAVIPSGPPRLAGSVRRPEAEGLPASPPLSLERVVLLGDRVRPREVAAGADPVDAYLGIDVGSVSTKVVALDEDGHVLKEIYTWTDGRPVEVTDRCLGEVAAALGPTVRIKGVGTTGSGRELIGELVGADSVNDEITAHQTGAEFLGREMLGLRPDTIFDIGGQDAKYISLQDGAVVDFAMNEACAAGTGSFLEERAEELGVSIRNEFADLALASRTPVKLGERCTVFMQQDVAAYQQRGAPRGDLIAGLAYSIVYNYLNRVVRGRRIGEVIFFQGGTAFNHAVAAALATVLDRRVIVPPYNGVIGAVGAALLARAKAAEKDRQRSRFRGFSLQAVDYSLREFTCKACANLCRMQEFTVEGEKTYWGDQCSDKFRRRQVVGERPVIRDLLARRRELLFAGYEPDASGKATIGLPRAMYTHEQFPFWNTFFRRLGFRVLLSDETSARLIRAGIEASVAEPCLPIQTYHGHVQNLLEKEVDWLFVPNLLNAETPFPEVNSHFCLWGQTLPFTVRSAGAFEAARDRFLSPSLRFRDGSEAVARALLEGLHPLRPGARALGQALAAAYEEQRRFDAALLAEGEEALRVLRERRGIGIVLVGRTYHLHDRGMILDVGSKLRDYYGVNVIPMDFLPVDAVDVSDVNRNMYWNYGRKILAAAKIVGASPDLHLIHLTSFKCGPDSYLKHYVGEAAGKPLLTLQFDGHGNDAGYLTRCEAFLQSRGVFRSSTGRTRLASTPSPVRPRAALLSPTNGALIGRTLWVPRMSADGAAAAAAAYRAFGIQGQVVPDSDAHSLELARRHTNGDECFPEMVTLGDFLRVVEAPGFDPTSSAFLLPTAGGPCRFGQYRQLFERILLDRGLEEAMVVSPASADGYQAFGDHAAGLPRLLWRAVVCADGLRRLLLQTRPYELHSGETDRVHGECLGRLCAVLERPDLAEGSRLAALAATMEEIGSRFAAVPARYDRSRPLIGVVGEIYCRLDAFANADLIRRVERYGGEVWLAGMAEWLFWVNFNERFNLRLQRRALSGAMVKSRLRDAIQRRDVHRLLAPLARRFEGYSETTDMRALVTPAVPYLPYLGALGEMVLGVSNAIHLHGQGADGVIDVCPFSCMNGIVCEAIYPRLGRDLDDLPIRNLYFDGTEGDHDRGVEMFIDLARAYQKRKRVPRTFPAHFAA